MTQRWIEIVIGKLVTDGDLRRKFKKAPRQTLHELIDRGMDLTRAEIAALLAIDSSVWERAADQIDLTRSRSNLKDE